jgi:hypothetical protein
VLVGKVGRVGFTGRLPWLRQLLVVLLKIGKWELLLGHVQLGSSMPLRCSLPIVPVSD